MSQEDKETPQIPQSDDVTQYTEHPASFVDPGVQHVERIVNGPITLPPKRPEGFDKEATSEDKTAAATTTKRKLGKTAGRIIGATGGLAGLVLAGGIAIGLEQQGQRDHNAEIAQGVQAEQNFEANLSDNQIIVASETADEQLKPDGTRTGSNPVLLGSFEIAQGDRVIDSAKRIIDQHPDAIPESNSNVSDYTEQFSASVAQGEDGIAQPGDKFNVVAEDTNGDGVPEAIVEPVNLDESRADKAAADQKAAYEAINKNK